MSREKILFISKITNFLFQRCGERHFLWFLCCLAVVSLCVLLVVSFNIIIFISSANYFVFPHWKAHEIASRKNLGVITSNAGISQNFKHWYEFLWWFTDGIMWCGRESEWILIFLRSSSATLNVRGRKSLFRIHKCLNKHEQKNCFLIIFKDFFILFSAYFRMLLSFHHRWCHKIIENGKIKTF